MTSDCWQLTSWSLRQLNALIEKLKKNNAVRIKFVRLMDVLPILSVIMALAILLSPQSVMIGDARKLMVVDLVLFPTNQIMNIDDTFSITIKAQCNVNVKDVMA